MLSLFPQRARQRRLTRWRRETALLLLAFSGLACGNSGQPPVFPVQGQVLYHGRPVAHALVVFHPLEGAATGGVRPHGRTQEDGHFTLTSYQPGDGAPAGTYRVTVEQWLSSGRDDEPPRNRLPARYAHPQTSGLTATVTEAPTELTLQLKP